MRDSSSERDSAQPTDPPREGTEGGRLSPIMDRVRDRVTTELNVRKERASEVLEDLAGTVRHVAEPLREGALASLAGYTDEAANRLGDIAAGMRERDVTELADDLRGVARRSPAAFAAVGFAAGLLAARFLKSSAAGRPTPPSRRPAQRPMTAERVERRVKVK
jgi:hypothetical protein